MTDAGKQAAVTNNVLTASPPGWNKGDLLTVVLPPVEDETWTGKNQPPLGEVVVCDGMSMTGKVYLRDYEPEFGWHPSRFRPVQQAASGHDKLAGYAGVKDAEVNKSLPTQGGGAGDLTSLLNEAQGLLIEAQEALIGRDDVCMDADGNDAIAIWREKVRSALQAAPSEGGEPVAWVWEDDIGDRHSTTRKDMADHLIMNGVDVQPAYARPPAPSEEPLVGCVVVPEWAAALAHQVISAFAPDEKMLLEALAAAPAPDAIRGGGGALQAASRPSVPAGGKAEGEGLL